VQAGEPGFGILCIVPARSLRAVQSNKGVMNDLIIPRVELNCGNVLSGAGRPRNHKRTVNIFAIGPQVMFDVGKAKAILKYQWETDSENMPQGNRFWFKLIVPL